MELQKLKEPMPYKWRVQSSSQYGSNCVAYIDARDVQDVLDNVCGPENWQNKYEIINGSMFCSIGIKINDEWIWKTDCGTESMIEKQKGLSSDAFKRAAVLWGVGRFLYGLKIRKIKEIKEYKGKYYPSCNGRQIYDVNEYFKNIDGKQKPAITNGQGGKPKKPKALARFEVVKKYIDDNIHFEDPEEWEQFRVHLVRVKKALPNELEYFDSAFNNWQDTQANQIMKG